MVAQQEFLFMSAIDDMLKDAKAIALMSVRIREEARELGATFSYIDPSDPDHMVVEHPDGRKDIQLLLPLGSKVSVHR
jgi:hypothetical protein